MKKYPYLYSISATLICLINVIFALLSLTFLFRIIFTFGTFVGTLIRSYQISNFSTFQKELITMVTALPLNDGPQKCVQDMISALKYDYPQLVIISSVMVYLFLLSPFMVILNGYGSFSLRFGRKGSTMLRVVHIVYALFCIIGMLSVVGSTVFYYLNLKSISAYFGNTRGIPVLFYLIPIALTLLLLILLILDFCYHKDIASHMFYITADRNKAPVLFKENHLSGISIFFALIWFALSVLCILGLQFSTEPPALTAEAILLAAAVRYLCVAAANRKLKKNVFHKKLQANQFSL